VATPFAFDRAWEFAVEPRALWATLARTDAYCGWWPWLRELRVDDGGLTTGGAAHVVIQAPLPYQLRCSVHVEEAVPAERLVAVVAGDRTGPARLELLPHGTGTTARLVWELAVTSPMLRPLSVVARPALAWAHDRIVERGLAQFETYALDERSG
jgi:uncharacterized protein YndB with AHSA1/START domain